MKKPDIHALAQMRREDKLVEFKVAETAKLLDMLDTFKQDYDAKKLKVEEKIREVSLLKSIPHHEGSCNSYYNN